MMQIAMLAGLTTAYQMNLWLTKQGWNEVM